MNESEENIIYNINILEKGEVLVPSYYGTLEHLINQAQLCNEMLFIANNITYFREVEKKAGKKKNPVYSDKLQENILYFNSIIKNAAMAGKIVIEGSENEFYSPAIFKSDRDNFIYFNDVEASRLFPLIIIPYLPVPKNSPSAHAYVLTFKKSFHILSQQKEPKFKTLAILISIFSEIYATVTAYYGQTIRTDRNGDRGRAKAGKTKLSLDILNEHLKHGMPISKMREELTKLGIKDRETIKDCIEMWQNQNKA